MTRVVGVHEVELKPGTDPAEFERAAAEAVQHPTLDGWRTRVLRGERGPRAGRYLVVFEIDDQEARNRYFPTEGQMDAEQVDAFNRQHPEGAAAWDRWQAMVLDEDVANDYVVVVEES